MGTAVRIGIGLVVLAAALLPFVLPGKTAAGAAFGVFFLLILLSLIGALVGTWKRWVVKCPRCGYRAVASPGIGGRQRPAVCPRCGSDLPWDSSWG